MVARSDSWKATQDMQSVFPSLLYGSSHFLSNQTITISKLSQSYGNVLDLRYMDFELFIRLPTDSKQQSSKINIVTAMWPTPTNSNSNPNPIWNNPIVNEGLEEPRQTNWKSSQSPLPAIIRYFILQVTSIRNHSGAAWSECLTLNPTKTRNTPEVGMNWDLLGFRSEIPRLIIGW
ncbi:predicted protein [Sclerotinia sclerotiorum 1980 UF-70]|uniref:Uncharacterized protein n=1 Tax=Sclerotinia sclerotiorum (strain ATCC 18683 / 1980 / Ss-1) TaxID=665079 RepID=A7EZ07_SCLS1|nr:predicted protein [Sclerotinia sclerotiorum 1980 UF-70]EDN94699.1 predicted protein [Sclerotinia sclerotiorum 1980 UF-70]